MSSNLTYTNGFFWKTLRRATLLERPPWLTVWEEDVLLPSGHQVTGYLLAEARSYAMTFAVTVDGQVPLVRQYKHGLRRVAIDLPAGYLDDEGEDPLQAAQRELREETGFGGGRWYPLGSYPVDSNRGKTCAHLYLAVGVDGDGHQHLDATEDIEVLLVPVARALEMARRGEINSLASVAGVFMAADRLREMEGGGLSL